MNIKDEALKYAIEVVESHVRHESVYPQAIQILVAALQHPAVDPSRLERWAKATLSPYNSPPLTDAQLSAIWHSLSDSDDKYIAFGHAVETVHNIRGRL
jgi:hypothetical protein